MNFPPLIIMLNAPQKCVKHELYKSATQLGFQAHVTVMHVSC